MWPIFSLLMQKEGRGGKEAASATFLFFSLSVFILYQAKSDFPLSTLLWGSAPFVCVQSALSLSLSLSLPVRSRFRSKLLSEAQRVKVCSALGTSCVDYFWRGGEGLLLPSVVFCLSLQQILFSHFLLLSTVLPPQTIKQLSSNLPAFKFARILPLFCLLECFPPSPPPSPTLFRDHFALI